MLRLDLRAGRVLHPFVPECGDGILDSGEECDDGNNVDGDGCASDCTLDEDDEDEDDDSDEFGDDLMWEWQEDGEGQGMSDVMASDDLLEDDNHTTTTDRARLDRRAFSSEHALLTALSEGRSLETRLKVIKELTGKVDVSLNALLIAHLERIRAEAEEIDKADLVNEAARLLSSLEE